MKLEDAKVMAFSDSPKLTTGFGNVAAMLYKNIAPKCKEFVAFGTMDHQPDLFGDLNYKFIPAPPLDPMGDRFFAPQVLSYQPDLLFIITDPGRARIVINNLRLHYEKNEELVKNGILTIPKVVLYTPIEGNPLSPLFGEGFKTILEFFKGDVVTYSPGSSAVVYNNFKLNFDYAYHGCDHADFVKYDKETRYHIRRLVGFEDLFIVGSGGVNKRTKGFDKLIYAARMIKDDDPETNIRFYFHTEPEMPVLGGYLLKELVNVYDVADMIMFKPDSNTKTRQHLYKGVSRGNKANLESLLEIMQVPDTPQERAELFISYPFITRINTFDMYLDASQIEGWGLWPFEAMACGVPTATVEDGLIRSEIHCNAAYKIKTGDPNLFTTWDTLSLLPNIDVRDLVLAIYKIKGDVKLQQKLSNAGIEYTSKFKWSDSADRIMNVMSRVLER